MSKVKLVFLSLFAVFAVSAVASASASASGPYMFFAGGASPLMGALSLEGTQSGTATLKGELAATKVEIQCTEGKSESAKGENVLTSGIEHFLGLILFHFLKCTMPKPAGLGCLIKNELIQVHSHILGLYNSGGLPRVQFYPLNNPYFTLINIDNCSQTGLNGPAPVEGTALAVPNNTTSTLEFTTTSGSNLTFGGNNATFTANFLTEMESGGKLEFK